MYASSSTSSGYGLVIRTWPLDVATKAFLQIEPILFALKLLKLRESNGTLKMDELVSKSTNFKDLPEEVMEMIRNQVFTSIDMKEVAVEALKKRKRCGYHENEKDEFSDDEYYFGTEESEPEPLNAEIWTRLRFIESNCEFCDSDFIQELNAGGVSQLLFSRDSAITNSSSTIYYCGIYFSSKINSVHNSLEGNWVQSGILTNFARFSNSALETNLEEADRSLIRFVKDWNLESDIAGKRPVEESGKFEKNKPSRWMWNDTHVSNDE